MSVAPDPIENATDSSRPPGFGPVSERRSPVWPLALALVALTGAIATYAHARSDPERIAIGTTFTFALLALLGLFAQRGHLARLRREIEARNAPARIGSALWENPTHGLVVSDPDGTIRALNPAAETLLGYGAAQLVGQHRTSHLYAPDQLQAAIDDLTQQLGHPIADSYESASLRHSSTPLQRNWQLLRADGSGFPACVTFHALRDQHGHYIGCLSQLRDLTIENAHATAAAHSRRQLEDLIRHAPASIALLDPDFRYLAVSDRWLQDFLLQDIKILGQSHLELFPHLPRHWRDTYRRCLAGAVESGEADTLTLHDGSQQWVRWECHPWRNEKGAIGGIALFAEVLTETRRAEKQLLESQSQLQTAQRLANLGSWELSVSSKVLQLSDETYRIHRRAPGSAFTTEQLIQDFHPDDRPILDHALAQLLQNQVPAIDHELRLTPHNSPDITWVRLIAHAEIIDGQITRIIGGTQDITTRKHTELQLTAAREEALQAARAKADFLANMSHELRTPLNAIDGMTTLLLDQDLSADQVALTRNIAQASSNLIQLISDLLDYSKLEAGHFPLDPHPHSLHDTLDNALDLVTPQAAQKYLHLLSWIDPALPPIIESDATRLQQILLNLLANAVKFTAHGEVILFATTRVAPTGEQLLHFTIRDTGIGIKPQHLPLLFLPYQQGETSSARNHGGTGLGLAISRHLVTLMGGQIWAESTPGQGSQFHFTLPLRIPADFPIPPTQHLSHHRCLLLVPHATTRHIVTRYLDALDVRSTPADSVLHALALLKREPDFTAIIVDRATIDCQMLFDYPDRPPLILLNPLGNRTSTDTTAACLTVLNKPLKAHQLRHALARITPPSAAANGREGFLSGLRSEM